MGLSNQSVEVTEQLPEAPTIPETPTVHIHGPLSAGLWQSLVARVEQSEPPEALQQQAEPPEAASPEAEPVEVEGEN